MFGKNWSNACPVLATGLFLFSEGYTIQAEETMGATRFGIRANDFRTQCLLTFEEVEFTEIYRPTENRLGAIKIDLFDWFSVHRESYGAVVGALRGIHDHVPLGWLGDAESEHDIVANLMRLNQELSAVAPKAGGESGSLRHQLQTFGFAQHLHSFAFDRNLNRFS